MRIILVLNMIITINLIYGGISGKQIDRKSSRKWNFVEPPAPKYGYNANLLKNSAKITENNLKSWNSQDGANIWEHSGLLEGDIMTYDTDGNSRNGVRNITRHWPNATIPFYIDDKDFSDEEITVILKAIQEYHNRTCIRFRPYEKADKNWITIKGNSTGCWSSVGMREEGQVVNLSTPKCVKHGVVLHELLHALGFYHQQSASDRDDYVTIHWENILDKHEYNFNKYNDSIVTSYGIEYDYGSVMHYSEKAFSKNGKSTIEAKKKGVHLGQRKELSMKDVTKLQKMYAKSCQQTDTGEEDVIKVFIDRLIEIFEKGISELLE